MGFRCEWRLIGGWLVVGVMASSAAAQAPRPAALPTRAIAANYSPPQIDYAGLAEAERALVRGVVDRPTLRTQGKVEVFTCRPRDYFWLLDNPDVAVRLWRSLGAKCTDIAREGEGCFGWRDVQGNQLAWRTVLQTSTQRIWYAEGHGKPGLLFPSVAVRAVVVLHHQEGTDRNGRTAIRHQAELIVQTESQAVALAARLLGASAPHLAEQYASQIEMFFGALAWYLDHEPEQGRILIAEAMANTRKAPVKLPNNQRRLRSAHSADPTGSP